MSVQTSASDFGFRILGSTFDRRRLIGWRLAFDAHCACDPRAEPGRECYMSAFTFGDEFRRHMKSAGSTKGYSGPCGAAYIWFDIDRENDIEAATKDARKLAAYLDDRYALDDGVLLAFFSGSKGFHIGLPTSLCGGGMSADYHRVARRFAEARAGEAGVTIDTGIYDKVRAFRAPNSRHAKSGLHKRRLAFDELLGMSVEAMVRLAAKPEEFEPPDMPALNDLAVADWRAAGEAWRSEEAARAERRAASNGSPELNRLTREFIREGAPIGDRHRLLFSCAANLAEFGCPPALAHALLTEPARDAGLTPSDVRRQIGCGLEHGGRAGE